MKAKEREKNQPHNGGRTKEGKVRGKTSDAEEQDEEEEEEVAEHREGALADAEAADDALDALGGKRGKRGKPPSSSFFAVHASVSGV